jgi:hypothetical protein
MAELESLEREVMAAERAKGRQAIAREKFTAIWWTSVSRPFDGSAVLADFTLAGPIEASARPLPNRMSRMALDPRGPTYWGISGHGLVEIDGKTSRATPREIQGDLPRLSWPCGVAFDTKRNRVVFTSLGGVGYMYAYDAGKDAWSLLGDMSNVDLESFTYSASEDCFYGLATPLGGDRAPSLLRYNPQGAEMERVEISPRLASDQNGMMHFAPRQVVALEGAVAILSPPKPGAKAGDGQRMTCVLVNPKTGKVTYSGTMRPQVEARKMDAKALQGLCKALDEGDDAVARTAAEQLSVGGDAAVGAINAKLAEKPGTGESESRLRLRAIGVLGRIGTPAAVDVLWDLAEGNDEKVVKQAKIALRDI